MNKYDYLFNTPYIWKEAAVSDADKDKYSIIGGSGKNAHKVLAGLGFVHNNRKSTETQYYYTHKSKNVDIVVYLKNHVVTRYTNDGAY